MKAGVFKSKRHPHATEVVGGVLQDVDNKDAVAEATEICLRRVPEDSVCLLLHS